ncbi:ferredoxin reductase family protein [Vibrio astriarenae]|uniref:ferredoxin reductase family protein n=1 Tax=Vibrio astriarenae TaxID=1481923 RepID=UPI0037363631
MKRLTIILVLLWLPSLLAHWESFDSFFTWRHQLIMLSGLLALGYMSIAVLLSLRLRWVETWTLGLDKSYQIHKQLGIGATVALIFHWLFVEGAKWLVQADIIARPHKGPRPIVEGIQWRPIAESVGEWTFYLFLVFAVISLIQAISYQKFKYVHKLGGLLMIAGVFHSLLLLDWNSPSMPMNIAIGALSIIGTVGALISLMGKIGSANRASGIVKDVYRYSTPDKPQVVRLRVQLSTPLQVKHGQFVFLNFEDGETPHPFSILNYERDKGVIEFAIKALGDYTQHLTRHIQNGAAVSVEGGYGCFQISQTQNQAWVGAGIGIVPFVSRLYFLQKRGLEETRSYEKIHLFYCVNSRKEALFESEIINLIRNLDFVVLHLVSAEDGEFLCADRLVRSFEDSNYDVSFCGPKRFGKQLRAALMNYGLPKHDFHFERFTMR